MTRIVVLLILFLSSCAGLSDSLDKVKSEYAKNNHKQVIDICTEALRKTNDNDTIYQSFLSYRAGSYMKLLEYQSAINDFLKLVEINKGKRAYYINLSFAYGELNDTINQQVFIEKAYQLDPNDILVLNNMAYMFSESGKYEKSIGYATQGLSLNPDDQMKALLLNNRGLSYLKLKHFDKALADIEQSIVLLPTNSFAYYHRALFYIETKDLEKACADLDKAKELGGVNITEELLKKYCDK